MDNNEQERGAELDLRRVITVLWRRAWIIVLAGILVASCAFCYAWFFVSPVYASHTKIYVRNVYEANNGAYSQAQIDGAQSLAKTYMVLLDSRDVWEQVQQKTGLPYTLNQIRGMVSTVSLNETEVFQITVRSNNYKHAAMIATALTEILPDFYGKIVEGGTIHVVEYPVESAKPVGPSYPKYIVLGAAIGVLLSVAIIIVLDLLDNFIDTEVYLTSKYADIPLLAVIPGDENGKKNYYKGKGYYRASGHK